MRLAAAPLSPGPSGVLRARALPFSPRSRAARVPAEPGQRSRSPAGPRPGGGGAIPRPREGGSGFAISSPLNAKVCVQDGNFTRQLDSGVVAVDSGQGRSWGFLGPVGTIFLLKWCPLFFRNWSVNALTSHLGRLNWLSGVRRTKFPPSTLWVKGESVF